MTSLVALLLATHVFGLTLQAPTLALATTGTPASLVAEPSLTLDALQVRELEAESRNRTTMEWTRSLHLGATITLAGAVALGAVQFGDEYGFHGGRAETACANNAAVFSDCDGETPWPHALAVGGSSVFGLGALIASTQVDFDRAARVDSDWRIYETTRWASLGLFLLQGALGFIAANAIDFGWAHPDRDFRTLQSLASAHLVLGSALTILEAVHTALLF